MKENSIYNYCLILVEIIIDAEEFGERYLTSNKY
jgi:hypothetical protein